MERYLQRSMHSKYGGVHFTQLRPVQDINDFVRSLPDDKRDSIFEVMQELDKAGYIHIENDGDWTDPSGEIHPHPEP